MASTSGALCVFSVLYAAHARAYGGIVSPRYTWCRTRRCRCTRAHMSKMQVGLRRHANVMNPYRAPDTRYRSHREGHTHSFARVRADTHVRTHVGFPSGRVVLCGPLLKTTHFIIGVPARVLRPGKGRSRVTCDVYAPVYTRNNNMNRRRKIITDKHSARKCARYAMQMYPPSRRRIN